MYDLKGLAECLYTVKGKIIDAPPVTTVKFTNSTKNIGTSSTAYNGPGRGSGAANF